MKIVSYFFSNEKKKRRYLPRKLSSFHLFMLYAYNILRTYALHLYKYIVEWRGNFIPNQTWFFPNMVEAHLNPKKYPNPEEFRPERFLDQEDTMASSLHRKVEDRDQFNFGWGR